MQNPLEEKLKAIAAAVERMKPDLVVIMGNEAEKFIEQNFKKQGFQGETFQAWKQRKKKIKGLNRKILIGKGSGHMWREWYTIHNADSAVISNPAPYAKIHNEGGVMHHPARERTLSFKRTKTGFKFGKATTEKQRGKIKLQWKGQVKGYDIHMPQRQMIGNSPVLTTNIKKEFVDEIGNRIKAVLHS